MMKQHGISLLELMISLFLFCLLIEIITQSYLNSKQQYLITQKKLDNTFDIQLVSQLIRASIRSAGFTPCLNSDYLIMQDRRNSSNLQLPSIQIKGNSLTIRHMSDNFFTVKRQLDSQHLLITNNRILTKGNDVLIADCVHGEVHELNSVEHTSSGLLVGLKKPLSFHYISPMYIGSWLEEKFFTKTDKYGVENLFYKLKHAEQLTSLVNHFSVKMLKEGRYRFIDVILDIGDKAINLHTRVRTSCGNGA
ncbi:Tfp pilus assembly protein PilW [Legionella busanensis]|uniref:Tfp pilus assembly protein PilW n=1 Tax=Legionella busanensis TaxID=190655 RepID=A0A378JJ01_9GAMM|nr:prepilin-type N-terminal cleavage/methylation domain-containing protein [Legionella busanensis]STX50731.1 Tfp pilus assembly protein PilW [Legionella busanensis]